VNKISQIFLIILTLVLILMVMDGLFIVPEGKQAIVTEFGKPIGDAKTSAGLKFKKPFIQKVTYFEKRILIWDGDPSVITTSDKKRLYINVTARWRISNALKYMQIFKNNEAEAQQKLDNLINSAVMELVAKNNLIEFVRSSDWKAGIDSSGAEIEDNNEKTIQHGRDKMAEMIHQNAAEQTLQYGIKLVDVMIKQVNYSDAVLKDVYKQMIKEREKIAAEKRSTGEGEKLRWEGKTKKKLQEIISGATRKSEEIRGKADAEAAKIYAEAYNQDPEFYAFFKSLQSYEKAMGKNTRLIMSSDAEFYKYLKTSN
jgi:modulator of FtsH protease HflC